MSHDLSSRESLFTKNLNDQLVWDVMFGVKSLLSKRLNEWFVKKQYTGSTYTM